MCRETFGHVDGIASARCGPSHASNLSYYPHMRDHSGLHAQHLALRLSSSPVEAEICKGLDQMDSQSLLVAAYLTICLTPSCFFDQPISSLSSPQSPYSWSDSSHGLSASLTHSASAFSH